MTAMAFIERLLIGDAPWAFAVEVIWRAAVMYLLLLIFMRLMGKRVAAQLTSIETAVILMLGAAIGLPIQVLTQGILAAVVVLATTTFLQRSLSGLALKSERLESMVYGDVVLLLCDGRMLLDNLRGSKLSREMLTSELRAHGVQHLGELRRVYMETSGRFSLVRFQNPDPGLSLSPDHDEAFNRELHSANRLACWSCGATVTRSESAPGACTYCAAERWFPAVETLTTPAYTP